MEPELSHALDEVHALPAAEEDALLERVRARVMGAVISQAQFHTVRPTEPGWQPMAPGVMRKLLFSAGDAQSWLVRLSPGSAVPGHPHTIDEECVVLEGTLCIGDDIVLHAGDFHVGRKGSTHALATSDTGALVYLRAAAEPA